MILLIPVILLFIGYSILILFYWKSWNAIPDYSVAQTATTKVSIIIPARNEEENIGRLLSTLSRQTYPKHLIQIIVVDDHSTDHTASIVTQFERVTLVQLAEDNINSYKKKAIETGIASATGDLIITTDADCHCSENWLQTVMSFYEEKNAVFIAAPVVIECNANLVQVFQAYDFAVLQGITGASVYKQIHCMCNGANMAYQRAIFHEVNGFSGIDQIASGDDMLLMHKIWQRYPDRVQYVKSKDAIMYTQPVKSWKEFFSQRIRWASKATHYNDKRILPVLLLVYLFNMSFVLLLVAGCWNNLYWIAALAVWVGKTIVEFPFVRSISIFFDKQYLLKYFFFLQPLHILYTLVSGLLGQFGRYEWKGRTVK